MTDESILKKNIESVLKREFVTPFIDSIRMDPIISLKLSNAFVLIRLSEQIIVEFDKNEVKMGKAINAVREKNLFLGYLGKLYQSALLLIGATDYLGAIILLRSIFELLIGTATTVNGRMRDRISSIEKFDNNEKSSLQNFWNELSAWAHPYGKWKKYICPKLYGVGRNYIPDIFEQCVGYSDRILDLMLTITIDYFSLYPEKYLDEYRAISEDANIMDILDLQMFKKRLMSP